MSTKDLINTNNIVDKCLLVYLKISNIGDHKIDKEISSKVVADYNADESAIKVRKNLFSSIPEHKAIASIATKARADFNFHTLPWGDSSTRIVTKKIYVDTLSKDIQEYELQFNNAVKEFIDNYDKIKIAVIGKMGKAWKESDFPSKEKIAEEFKFSFNISTVPNSDDFRLSANKEFEKEYINAYNKTVENAIVNATNECTNRMKEKVYRLYDRLSKYSGNSDNRIRVEIVETIKELAEFIKGFNVINSAKINEMYNDLIELSKYDAEELREVGYLRESVVGKAKEIMDKLSLPNA